MGLLVWGVDKIRDTYTVRLVAYHHFGDYVDEAGDLAVPLSETEGATTKAEKGIHCLGLELQEGACNMWCEENPWMDGRTKRVASPLHTQAT